MPTSLVDPKTKSFEEARRSFRWQVPGDFNMAGAVCDRLAGKSSATALLCETVQVKRHATPLVIFVYFPTALPMRFRVLESRQETGSPLFCPNGLKSVCVILRRGRLVRFRFLCRFYLEQTRYSIDCRTAAPESRFAQKRDLIAFSPCALSCLIWIP